MNQCAARAMAQSIFRLTEQNEPLGKIVVRISPDYDKFPVPFKINPVPESNL
jgi:hypothetical protein